MTTIDELCSRRLVVCVGPGGVGKTTLAAALAVEAAARGRRALVLTIDPARRLAGALGLDGLDDTVREVDVSSIVVAPAGAVGARARGALHAAMLDTSSSYDSLIARIAPGETARDRILGNRVYRAFSKTLARSHAYVAMERLYDVTLGDDYDLVVLDTPPMRSALEILDAPRTLARFLDDRVVRFFVGRVPDPIALDEASPRSLTGAAALRILGAIASRELVEEMVGFFNLFASMREGFSERARRVDELLRGDDTSFVLVGSVDPAHLDDARAMRDGLIERELVPDLVVLNRSYPPEPGVLAAP
ncbi:MAG: AAA family ATPase, partial [Deltaproteobacteria bacterium]|nr:AAA family ATPase [Deltaproteobacteria bacterium]